MIDHDAGSLSHYAANLGKHIVHRDVNKNILETVKDAKAIDAFAANVVWSPIHKTTNPFLHIQLLQAVCSAANIGKYC